MNASENTFIVLVVDDDPDDRQMVKDALDKCDIRHDIFFLENGEELVDYLSRNGDYNESNAPYPSLVLLDIKMPKMDGVEALQKIKSLPTIKSTPIIMLSTSRNPDDIAQAYDVGANSFISKPVNFNELVTTMNTLAQYWFQSTQLPKNLDRRHD